MKKVCVYKQQPNRNIPCPYIKVSPSKYSLQGAGAGSAAGADWVSMEMERIRNTVTNILNIFVLFYCFFLCRLQLTDDHRRINPLFISCTEVQHLPPQPVLTLLWPRISEMTLGSSHHHNPPTSQPIHCVGNYDPSPLSPPLPQFKTIISVGRRDHFIYPSIYNNLCQERGMVRSIVYYKS